MIIHFFSKVEDKPKNELTDDGACDDEGTIDFVGEDDG